MTDGDDRETDMLRRARMTVAYDGSSLHGFSESDDVDTVMGALRDAVEKVVRGPANLVGAGRTDAGVHGWGQVVSGDLPATTDLASLARRVNRMCGPRIAVRDLAWTDDPEFNARYSAVWRHYRFSVLNSPEPNPFLAATAWHVVQPLELWTMQLACDPLVGEHDFTSFCRRPKVVEGDPPPSMVRRVIEAGWQRIPHEQTDGLLRFDIRANAFCHQMVRALVGTLVDIGAGKLHAGEMRGILVARDRAVAGQVAPPHGLCLWEVGYA